MRRLEHSMGMNKTVLITRPRYDQTTAYLCGWCEPVIVIARQKQYRVLNLVGGKATQAKFESYLKNQKPGFFFLNGHGSSTVVLGDNHKPMLIQGLNDDICADAIAYIRSCDVGKSLAISLVKKGARACIAYKRKFGFVGMRAYMKKILDDPLAKMYLEPSNLIAIAILKGHSVREAHWRGIEAMQRSFNKLISSERGMTNINILVTLSSNIQGQVLLGDGNAMM